MFAHESRTRAEGTHTSAARLLLEASVIYLLIRNNLEDDPVPDTHRENYARELSNGSEASVVLDNLQQSSPG